MIRERRETVAWTLRTSCGVGLSDLGDAVSWGEACALIRKAAADPGTALGAELAKWAYPATMPQILHLITAAPSRKASEAMMPWSMKMRQPDAPASAVEVAQADLELEADFVFT